MVRQTTQKRAGQRYLVHDAISRDCRPFITAHEVAEWWVWQIGVYLHYCWSGPTHHDWFGFPVNDFISLASENAEHMRTKLATAVNVPLLRQLVTDEGFKLAAIADNRVIPSRPGSTENEWLTDPVPEIDVSRVLRLFEDPDSHDAPRILGLSIRTHHNTDSLRAHQTAHQTPDSGAPMPKNGSRKKKSGHSMSSAEPY